MSRVPDAWDDDYESLADKTPSSAPSETANPQKISRAQQKAKHAEATKKLWNSAENPETFHFVDAKKDTVPLKSDFRPAMRVLSRKPKPPNPSGAPTRELQNGMSSMNLASNDEYDSEEEARRERERDVEAKQEQTKKEREEKQRRYNEVRERLFGSPSQTQDGKIESHSPNRNTVSGRGRRGGLPQKSNSRGPNKNSQRSSAEASPTRSSNKDNRQLFDPSYSQKPTCSCLQRREQDTAGVDTLPASSTRPIREPRGPDPSGRGGFATARRGNRAEVT